MPQLFVTGGSIWGEKTKGRNDSIESAKMWSSYPGGPHIAATISAAYPLVLNIAYV